MTDSVVVEGLVKIRDGKKWKSRWVVLRKPSPVADCLVVLVYKERGERALGQRERSSVTLEHIYGLEPGLPYEGLGHSLTILCLSQSVALGFDCKETLQAWGLRLRYSLGEVHRFGVAVLPGTKVETGPATLYLCNNLLVIARDVPPVIIGQWNLLDLRRYGPVTNGFVFEGGTRCGFWAGVFFLSCAEGEQISFLFDCIVRGISPSRGPFGLRPVLPDPNVSPASIEERLNHDAQELEKRLSMLSHCSHISAASTSSYSTSVAGDDRSISGSSDTSDTSQSDSSIGSRLAMWADPTSSTAPAEAASQSGAKSVPLLVDEKLPVALGGGARLPTNAASSKPTRSRRLQEIGRQSSSDSGIATGSHSSYSGSFSSYTSSLDATGGSGTGDDFGSILSLPPPPLPLTATAPAERTLCTCPPCPGHEYQVPSLLRYLYDTPRSLLHPPGTAKGSDKGASSGSEDHPGTTALAEASKDSEASQVTAAAPGRLSRGSSSEVAPPGDERAEVCQICTPRAIYTACSICGGLKGAPLAPAVPSVPLVPDIHPAGQRASEQSVTADQEAYHRTALETTPTPGSTNPGQEKLPLTAPSTHNRNPQKHGYLTHLSDLLEHYNIGASSGSRTSSHNGYEPMASALISKASPTTCSGSGKHKPSQSWKDTIIYENCLQCCRGERGGCKATGVNRREKGRGGDALLDWRKSCNTPCQKLLILEGHGGERGRAPENKPKDVPSELGITAVMVPSELGITAVMVPSELGITTVMVPSELGITAVMGARSEEVSNGSVDVEEDKKKQRCKADLAYEVMESRTTERSSEVEEKSKYELMGSYGQQRIPHMDLEGGVFVFPSDVSTVTERPRGVGDGVTYVNIPVSPTSKKQLNYMELELQETSASVRGRSSTKYAQIDITATETAHKVGTQHALGREEGLLKLEQKRRGGLPQ